MSQYAQMVNANQEAFITKGILKLAIDLAKILDWPVSQIAVDGKGTYGKPIDERLNVFNLFCAVCLQCKVPVPELEPAFYKVYLPVAEKGELEKVKGFTQMLRDKVAGNRKKAANQIRAMAEIVDLFLMKRYDSVDLKKITAMTNAKLVELGLEPIRPDYAKMEINLPKTQDKPGKLVKILIVDDNLNDIVHTALALAGIENVEVDYFHFVADNYKSENGRVCEKVAMDILGLPPCNIILMDQGLGGIDGHEVIVEIRKACEDKANLPVFIGNTGGNTDEFEKIGIYSNFEKGRNFRCLRDVICR